VKGILGIDLGSTTTKAVVIGQDGRVCGRGLTNTRANFETACLVVRAEALFDARFAQLPETERASKRTEYRRAVRRHRLGRLRGCCARVLADGPDAAPMRRALTRLLDAVAPALDVTPEEVAFRDGVLSQAALDAEKHSAAELVSYEALMGAFERAVVLDEADPKVPSPDELLDGELGAPVDLVAQAGTGYGRHRLPFAKNEIRSEILCHGLGAHHAFPATRTVLDIGGQDTKAIQLDDQGLVTSFQMNDRCAAGCGRYLGYVADELGLALPELGPLALASGCPSRINSTCTVFAGAEIRERLALGEKREDVVAGLHRAIVLRALGLLARSGGVTEQLTFSGGVGKNQAVVKLLRESVAAHYGAITVNVSPDGIYNGAIGAALFARMSARLDAPGC